MKTLTTSRITISNKMKLICFAQLIFPVIGNSQIATTTIDPSTTVMANPKLLLGITYDARSSLSISGIGQLGYHNSDATFIPEVATIFDNFPMSTLRYPANAISNGFQWQQSIGPVASRPLVDLVGNPNSLQKMEFGFDEFMKMTAARGVAPKDVQIMVPIYDKTDPTLTPTQNQAAIANVIQSNADWVEYANAPNDGSNPGGGIDWAAIRSANGRDLPYGIKIWNMGNEPYAAAEYTTNGVDNYINNIVPIIDAMRSVDPTIQISVTGMLKIINPGGNFPLGNWTYRLLNSAALAGKIYAINVHSFLTEDPIGTSVANRVFGVTSFLKPLAAASLSKGYKLILGDHAHFIPQSSTIAEQNLAMQWQGANLAADLFLSMSQIPNLERSNFWVFGNAIATWHPIRKNGNGTYTSMPVAELYKKLFPLFLDNSLSVTNTSPVASDGNPYSVRSGAFASSDLSKINVIAVNRDRNNAVPLQVNGISGYTLSNSRIVTASALTAESMDENQILADANGNYLMPAVSILILEYSIIQTTPVITWYDPADIIQGTALSATELNAKADVPGTFVYTPDFGNVLAVGTHSLTVDFTPTDGINYTTASQTVQINVTAFVQTTPVITWYDPADIVQGTALSTTELNAKADVPGTFVYTPDFGKVLAVGTHSLLVDFTPADGINYTTASQTVQINVTAFVKKTPIITWANPASIVQGTALSATQLNALANVPGTYVYAPGLGTVLAVGTHTLMVDFAPTDAVNYTNLSQTVQIDVKAIVKKTPIITWANQASIVKGTALGATELNATADVPGTFVYAPPLGTVLAVGTHTLMVDFTPTDTVNFTTASQSVQIDATAISGIIDLINNKLYVYPNPCDTELKFSDYLEKFIITNSLGQEILRSKGNEVSTVELKNGVYFLKTEDKTLRFIVKH